MPDAHPSPAATRRPNVRSVVGQLLRPRYVIVAVIAVSCVALSYRLWPVPPRQTIGVEAARVIEIRGPELFAPPFTPGDALSVRIDSTTPTADGFRYDLRFVAYGPGEYRLADWLRDAQGELPQNAPNTAITIDSILPGNFAGELFSTPASFIELRSGYRGWMALAWMSWGALLVPLLIYGRRWRIDALPPPPAPSLNEQIGSLLSQATQRPLRIDEQADLEHLLWAWWSARLNLSERLGETLEQLHRHPVAGRQLKELETAFHSRGGLLDRDVAQGLLDELAAAPIIAGKPRRALPEVANDDDAALAEASNS